MKTIKIKEGAINLNIPKAKRIYDAPVFYNPEMITNRDISVLICKILKPKTALDLLAATGIRGLRLKKEAKIKDIYINDANPVAFKLIKKNAKLNKLKVKIFNLRAHKLLATRYSIVPETKFEYIDVDPFGTPVPFLDAAIKALTNGGIIGITATDTSALCGTYPEACLRKYGSWPLKNELMHELGIRILIKKAQEVGAQYDIALTPIFAHSSKHYMRVYLKAEYGARASTKILAQIDKFGEVGPLWLDNLWDEKLVTRIKSTKHSTISPETAKLLYMIAEESKIHTFGFYNIHAIAKKYKIKKISKMTNILADLHEKGYQAARTHFSKTGIRSNAPLKLILKLIKA